MASFRGRRKAWRSEGPGSPPAPTGRRAGRVRPSARRAHRGQAWRSPRPRARRRSSGPRCRGRPRGKPPCAAAMTNEPVSMARARSSTSQCASPVGRGEGGRRGDHRRSGQGQGAMQGREAHVVADGQAELAERRVHDHGRFAGRVGRRLPRRFTGRKIHVEHVQLVVGGDDRAGRIDDDLAIGRLSVLAPAPGPSRRRSRSRSRPRWRAGH